MATSKLKELEVMVQKLHEERQGHLDAIAEIDATFEQLGLVMPESPAGAALTRAGKRRRKPGPKPGRKKGVRRGGRKKAAAKPTGKKKVAKRKVTKKKASRGKAATGNRYAVSGTDLITGMVSKAGAKGVPGGEINKVWKAEGRAGTAYNILSQLVKQKKVKRKDSEGRGSLYVPA